MKAFVVGSVVGAAAGYLQGTKAGRERYEQIRRRARSLASTPIGQRITGLVSEVKERGADQAEEVMTEVMTRAAGVNAEGQKV